MTEGIPEWPYAQCPVPIVDRDHNFLARPSERLMDSGRIRRRRKQAEMQEFIKVRWSLTEDQFEAFIDFFELTLTNGSTSFLMKTFEPGPTNENRLATVWWELAFVGANGGYTYTRGDNSVQVSANLEVIDKLIVEENPLPPIVFGYFHDEGHDDNDHDVETNPSACRENVSVLMDDLEEGALYTLEIAETSVGPWDTFIYFALLTTEERATKHKRVSMSNYFGGIQPWFRVKLYRGADSVIVETILTQSGQPLEAEVEAPDLTVANLSEITTYEQLATQESNTSTQGIQPLDAYKTTNGFVIPYSYLEDPMTFSSRMYRPFIRKYVLRQHSWGHWGTLLSEGDQNNPATITGPPGATLKWTRDGTVPTLATPPPLAYGGVPNNVYAIRDEFAGVLMARCFLGSCPSPLVMVCIDKLMYERPSLQIVGPADGVSGYCDLPQIDIVTGLPSESGNSCAILYGGICNHETLIVGLGWTGGSNAVSRNSPFANHGPALRKMLKRVSESVYIGWPIHSTAAEYFQFESSIWNNSAGTPASAGYFNHWQDAPRTHNWAILCKNIDPFDQELLGSYTFLDVIKVPFGTSLCGAVGTQADAERAAWDPIRDLAIHDIMELIDPPDEICTQPATQWIYADRFDIIRSPLYIDEPRNLHWLGPVDLDEEITEIPFDPDPETEPVNPYDKFEAYDDGDVTGNTTLDFKIGVHWDAAWTMKNGSNVTYGWDLFEDYADGAAPEHGANLDVTYIPYRKGENWYVDTTTAISDEWVFRVGDLAQVYKDDFESYSNGAVPFSMTGGNGWNAADSNGWRMDNDLIGGSETWDTYADGAFTGSNTGSNFLLSENWRTT